MPAQKLLIACLMFSLLSFWACRPFRSAPLAVPAAFDWQGHRGCRGLMPENTLPAFLHALSFPQLTTLELDLAVSKDGQLIVSHEPWFNPAICRRPGGDTIPVREAEQTLLYRLTAAQIRDYDCGSWGNARFTQQQRQPAYKPTLREVVQAVRAQSPHMRWNMEIKSELAWDGLRHPPVEEFVRLLADELKALGIEEQSTVQSFDVRALQAMRRRAPHLTLALLVENTDGLAANLRRLGFTPPIYSPYYASVNPRLVRQCRARSMRLIPWTVNDTASMRALIRLGVDGIITDYPNLIAELGQGEK